MGVDSRRLPRIRAGVGYKTRAEEHQAKAIERLQINNLMQEVRTELIKHLGGTVSLPQSLVIDIVAIKVARLSVMASNLLDARTSNPSESDDFLTWSESLGRDLKMLADGSDADLAPTINKFLKTAHREETQFVG